MSRWRAFDFPLVRPCTTLFTTNEDHFFLDDAATCPCLSAAHYVYPIRVRFPDIVTGNMDWTIAGFIPIIKLLRQPPKPALVSRSYCGLPG